MRTRRRSDGRAGDAGGAGLKPGLRVRAAAGAGLKPGLRARLCSACRRDPVFPDPAGKSAVAGALASAAISPVAALADVRDKETPGWDGQPPSRWEVFPDPVRGPLRLGLFGAGLAAPACRRIWRSAVIPVVPAVALVAFDEGWEGGVRPRAAEERCRVPSVWAVVMFRKSSTPRQDRRDGCRAIGKGSGRSGLCCGPRRVSRGASDPTGTELRLRGNLHRERTQGDAVGQSGPAGFPQLWITQLVYAVSPAAPGGKSDRLQGLGLDGA